MSRDAEPENRCFLELSSGKVWFGGALLFSAPCEREDEYSDRGDVIVCDTRKLWWTRSDTFFFFFVTIADHECRNEWVVL